MIIFYSGDGGSQRDFGYSHPELVLGIKADLMLTYWFSHGKRKPELRFRRYRKLRRTAVRGGG